MRDMVRIRYYVVVQEMNCQWSITMQAPWRSLHQGERFLTTCRLLVLEPYWHGFLFVASFGMLYSTFCWSPLFLLCKELNFWLGHGQNEVQECWCRCWLLQVVLVEVADYLPEVHDYKERFSGVFFFWITLPNNQII